MNRSESDACRRRSSGARGDPSEQAGDGYRRKTRAIRFTAAVGVAASCVVGLASPATAAPGNDDRSGAVDLALGSPVSGTTAQASLEPGEVASSCPTQYPGGEGGNTVWYRYTNTTTSSFSVTFTLSSANDQGIAIWDSTGSTELTCDDSGGPGAQETAAIEINAGQVVLVSVYRFAPGDEGPFNLAATEGTVAPPGTRPFVNGVIGSEPPLVDFGQVAVGSAQTRIVTYTNTSGASAEVPLVVSGSGEFFQGPATTCALSQATITIPSAGCDLEIGFNPTAPGAHTTTLTLQYTNEAGDQDTTTTLQAEGVDDGQPPPEVPEAPLALLLPGSTLILGAGIYAVRRRRNRAAVVTPD